MNKFNPFVICAFIKRLSSFNRIFFKHLSFGPRRRSALIDQIRRSSRSIGANIAEAWAKRLYPQHFISKLTDADGELQETAHWLNTAAACGYISGTEKVKSQARLDVIGKMLGKMLAMPEKFACRLQD